MSDNLIKCVNKAGEIRWLAPSIANNPIRMEQIECTIFPTLELPPEPKETSTMSADEASLIAADSFVGDNKNNSNAVYVSSEGAHTKPETEKKPRKNAKK